MNTFNSASASAYTPGAIYTHKEMMCYYQWVTHTQCTRCKAVYTAFSTKIFVELEDRGGQKSSLPLADVAAKFALVFGIKYEDVWGKLPRLKFEHYHTTIDVDECPECAPLYMGTDNTTLLPFLPGDAERQIFEMPQQAPVKRKKERKSKTDADRLRARTRAATPHELAKILNLLPKKG